MVRDQQNIGLPTRNTRIERILHQCHPLLVDSEARERPPVSWDRLVLKEDQAAEFLKRSPQTLRKRAATGEIPRYVVGGEWRYYVYDLLDYVIGDRDFDRSGGELE